MKLFSLSNALRRLMKMHNNGTKCVFCKIIAGTERTVKVYEDDLCIAIMDIAPVNRGHLLVIPKKHYETVLEMPFKEAAHIFGVACLIAKAVKKALGAEGVNILQNNGRAAWQHVFHVHVHVIPRWVGDEIYVYWPAKLSNLDELENVAISIRRSLNMIKGEVDSK
ncbi:HIT family protein [Candidatus Nezhaarchaeota archaeon WYZ-LMO8]|nr:MAG: HIT family protein [Candidatus Nezhaarchaeota archaeon WYZ-LMO8]TDA36830.1 MAG: HIT family protein [Candidatus Nezhaarchaeota archaeon WYZ-LMO7]